MCACMCTCVCVCVSCVPSEARGSSPVSRSTTFHPFPLRQCLSMNPELTVLVILADKLQESTCLHFRSAGTTETSVCCHNWLFPRGFWGSKSSLHTSMPGSFLTKPSPLLPRHYLSYLVLEGATQSMRMLASSHS